MKKIGFDNDKYLKMQSEHIRERISKFGDKLYLEFGGKLFDATQTMVCELGNGLYEVQVVSWYDNENSYTSQMVRTIKYFAELN